MQKMMSVLLGS